jgi:hypothetical protein
MEWPGHLDARGHQLSMRLLDVVDHQVQSGVGPRLGPEGHPDAEGDRTRRARRRHLHDPEGVAGVVVDVQVEAEPAT